MHYRKDIQILRGIAVLLVVLYHLQITGIQSGFLGVDIFFVISGFLMAILYSSENKGKFFSRRIKRLLPTYFTVIIFTLLISIFLTIPNEYNQVAKQSIYATLFSSNIGFWMQNSYFSKTDFNPLLHLWSLGVEIQFYLIVPILYWFFHKSKIFFLLFFVGSLVVSAIILGISPKTSFFMMPLRLWEFLIGYGVAIYLTKIGNIKYTSLRGIGLLAIILLIGIPLFTIDGEAIGFLNGHPGFFALIVSLATGIILAFGLPVFIERSKLGTLLEVLGKYSYSIYLVHFPVIVLFLYQPFSGTILKVGSFIQTGIMIILISFLSVLMYRYVENPSRHSKKIMYYLFLAIPLIFIVMFLGQKIKQLTYTPVEQKIFHAWEDRTSYRCGKLIRVLNPSARSCDLTDNIKKPDKKIFLVGNSHADSIKSAFTSVATTLNVKLLFTISNTPLMKGSRIHPKDIVYEALTHNIDTIVLHYSPNAIKVETIQKLVGLASVKDIKVAMIMPVPVWDKHIPQALYEYYENDVTLPRQTRDDYMRKNEDFYQQTSKIKNLRVYTVHDLLCLKTCHFQDSENNLFYFDEGHLTLTGSMQLEGIFKSIILNTLDY